MKISYTNTGEGGGYMPNVCISWFHNLTPNYLRYLDMQLNTFGGEIIFEHWK
jgi:hypothetical protein